MVKNVGDGMRQESRLPQRVNVKIQAVRSIDLDLASKDLPARTIGQHVDAMLADIRADGEFPNKLVLDLDPPLPVERVPQGWDKV